MKRFCAAVVGLGLITGLAEATDYEFTKIADTAGGEFAELSFASINNDGTVLFRGESGSVAGVYSAPPATAISDENDARFESLSTTALGNNGFVAFDAFEAGGLDNAIYRTFVGDNDPPELLYGTNDGFSCVSSPSINSSGIIAFIGESGSNCLTIGVVSLYVGSGETPTLIDTSADFLEITSGPTINDDGTVMFMADRTLDDFGIYTWNGQSFTTIVENGNTYLAFLGPSINCNGTVAAAAIPIAGGGRTIIKGSGGAVTIVVDTSVGLIEFRQPSINCSETIAFIARTPDFLNDGIYVTTDEGIDTVIMTGDMLEGLTVENIFTDMGFNDSGQLVFRVRLSDGNQYIFVANPAPDPHVDVTGVADVSGDGVADVAELRLTGQPRVRYFSGASRQKIRTVSYLGPAWHSVAGASVADGNADGVAGDPAVAVLAHKPVAGKHAVEVRRSDDGSLINKIFFLSESWEVIDVAVIDDKNGDGVTGDTAIAVLGYNPNKVFDEQIKVQVRKLSNGKLLGSGFFLNANWTPLALEAVNRIGTSPLLAVLANKAATGANVIQARRFSDGGVQRDTSFFDASWIARDLAVLRDADGDGNANDPAYLVLANQPETGRNKVQARRVSDGARIRNVTMLGTNWDGWRVMRTGDISGNLVEEIGVLADKNTDGTVAIQLKDFADRTTTATILP